MRRNDFESASKPYWLKMPDSVEIPLSLLIEVREDLANNPIPSARGHLEIIDRLLQGKSSTEDNQELLENYWEQ